MSSDREVAEAGFVRDSMLQHSMALTMAEVCGHHTQLLTQDPDYTTEAKERLEGKGFSVIGQFGAGGFAEINNTSVVFSVFVEAPRKQIVADIARPLLIITTGFEVLNDSECVRYPLLFSIVSNFNIGNLGRTRTLLGLKLCGKSMTDLAFQFLQRTRSS